MAHSDTPRNVTPAPWLAALAGRYDDIRELGRGGMGIVYKALDRQTGDAVAIKVLRPELSGDPAVIDRFKSELLLARRITHKNVCRVYELTEFGSVSVISMELVEGESLRTLLTRQESLSVRFGLKVLGEMLAGLSEAHAQGVIHRDLKPENILIDAGGAVKLMDFGIARDASSRATSTGTAIGTPAYMSPEQIEGRTADARSDIYALGLVMYEMFCGQPAFSHPSPLGVLAKQTYETPPAPRAVDSTIPPRIERSILKCLEKDPAKRFQAVSEVRHALFEDPAQKPTPALPLQSVISRSLSNGQRTDWLLVVGALAGLLVFGATFHQTSLADRSQVTFDRAVLKQIVQQQARRLSTSVSGEPVVSMRASIAMYWYLLTHAGAEGAHALANEVVPLVVWRVQYPDGPLFQVDARGRLLSFVRDDLAPEAAPLPLPDARARAADALREFFDVSVANLELEREGTVGAQTTLSWKDPQAPHGLMHRYLAVLDARGIGTLSSTYESPTEVSLPLLSMETWYSPVSIALVLALAVIGFLQRDRVDLTTRWRMVFAALGFLAVFGEGMYYVGAGLEPGSKWAVGIGVGFTAAVLWVLMSAASEDRVRRFDPTRLLSMELLFGRTARSPLCGLSVLRGALIGLALLGLDTAMVWVVTTSLGGQPDPDMFLWFLALGLSSRSVAVPLAGAIIQMLWIGAFVAFVASLGGRRGRSILTAVVLPASALALAGAHFSMGSVQPFYWTMLLLLIDYVVLVIAFQRYDLLTLFSAIFTFAFVWGTYMLHVALQQAGGSTAAIALGVGAMTLLVSAIVAFQSHLRTAFSSLAGGLD